MSLPPYARRLDVRATRAAFAAGTLSTVRDHPRGEHKEGRVETGDADRHNQDAMPKVSYGDNPSKTWREGVARAHSRWTEAERQAFLRRAQHVDPRERRA